MIRTSTHWVVFIALAVLTATPSVLAQSSDTPMKRLRPIGAASAVDQFGPPSNTPSFRETAYQPDVATDQASGSDDSGVRQTVLHQQFDAPPLPGTTQPPDDFAPPPTPPPPSLIPTPSQPPPARVLPVNPGTYAPGPLDQLGRLPSNSDLAPLVQPQLNDGFATIDNCPCVSPPSSYTAASGWGGCATASYQTPQAYVAPPAQIVGPPPQIVGPPPQIVAPSFVPVVPVTGKGTGIPHGALISFGQERNPVQVGQGLIGQPVAYVPGQPIRNWVRYFFP